ncbi:MAG: ABC transporter ATP-binding protein [Oscillospiraceae bacterium]|nr:ABC transporter ATP-binding protein [Oscillospiraceae bacterium]
MNDNTLRIEHLKTYFYNEDGILPAVDDVSIVIPKGKIIGIVGESGCGKSMTAKSIINLVKYPGKISGGEIWLGDTELTKLSDKELRKIRGSEISMIFQEPMTSLNPVVKAGKQVLEALMLHKNISKKDAKKEVLEIFRSVGISEPEKRYNRYPHELSGGLRQRMMIAMAMVCRPKLLIADEPTTALDVTIEAQILQLMKNLRDETGMSILIISHNLGVIAELCDYVYVMYAGKVVEQADVCTLFNKPVHPYTKGLISSIIRLDREVERLGTIPGFVPNLMNLPEGCSFCPRCALADDTCRSMRPDMLELEPGHCARCFKAGNGGNLS